MNIKKIMDNRITHKSSPINRDYAYVTRISGNITHGIEENRAYPATSLVYNLAKYKKANGFGCEIEDNGYNYFTVYLDDEKGREVSRVQFQIYHIPEEDWGDYIEKSIG